jgi:hypothetical protein
MKPQLSFETAPPAPAGVVSTKSAKLAAVKRERLFYSCMAATLVIAVVAGFARTYYLRPLFANPEPLPFLLHLHGLVFSSWLVLYATQTFLVAAKKTRVHRRLGMAGAALATSMVLLGTYTALVRAKAVPVTDDFNPFAFLIIPLGDMVMFAALVTAGIALRRRPDAHKRLMQIAMISISTAGIARIPGIAGLGPLAFFGVTDLFVVACFVYDKVSLGRIHRATLAAGLAVVLFQPLRIVVAGTPLWIDFARWAANLVG